MAKLNSKSLCRCETGALANKRFSVATPPHGIIAFNRVKPSIGCNLVSGRAKRAPLVSKTSARQGCNRWLFNRAKARFYVFASVERQTLLCGKDCFVTLAITVFYTLSLRGIYAAAISLEKIATSLSLLATTSSIGTVVPLPPKAEARRNDGAKSHKKA